MKKNNILAKALLAGAIAATLAVIWRICGTLCLFRYFTGIICPGCGMTRAWLSALRLDFSKAFHYNPTFWIIPFIIKIIFNEGRLCEHRKANIFLISLGSVLITITYLIRLWAYLNGFLTI